MNMKTTYELLEKIIEEKNLTPNTIQLYKKSIEYFEEQIDMSLIDFLEIVETEEVNGTRWKNSTAKKELTKFRNTLNQKYKHSTASIYLSKIIAILNHYELEVGKLPKIKTKQHKIHDISGNITQKELNECINQPNTTEIKPLTLLLSSTGLSPVDALNITISDYLKSTSDYHNYTKHKDILKALDEMDQQDVIPTFRGHRQKTGVEYITFASHECVQSINIFIRSKEKLNINDPIFTLAKSTMVRKYKEINDHLELGVNDKGEARFTMKGLRSFHSTQLELAGMSESRINILEGRENKNVINQHYIKVDSAELKKQYIECLPYLLIEDINKVKSELENEKEKNTVLVSENTILKEENTQYKEVIDSIDERIENKMREVLEKSDDISDFDDLFS